MYQNRTEDELRCFSTLFPGGEERSNELVKFSLIILAKARKLLLAYPLAEANRNDVSCGRSISHSGPSLICHLTHPATLRARPSLLRKEGEYFPLFPRSEERVVQRSADRVNKLTDITTHCRIGYVCRRRVSHSGPCGASYTTCKYMTGLF